MGSLMNVARERGLQTIEGDVLANNVGMLRLMSNLGFTIHPGADSDDLRVVRRRL